MATVSCDDVSKLSNTDIVLLESILEYYNDNHEHIIKFLGVVKRKNGMSLRVIDWLVTNYSKEHSITISIQDGHLPRDLNRDYQKNLNAYNKRALDPFSRRNKINVKVSHENNDVEHRATSIGQLNFFRWFFRNSVDVYLSKEKRKIELHMKKSEYENKNSKKKSKKKHIFNCPRSYVGSFTMDFD